ncbi:hypothetical protein [Staphylococcus phage ZCSS1]|uniref:Phage protein n=1 Tax=Staphylococcus phage UHP46 TaxID=3234966 RepID=A0AB39C8L9_9CAUD|nr:hypothetical protein [Staphylococcus phage ZCSS1]
MIRKGVMPAFDRMILEADKEYGKNVPKSFELKDVIESVKESVYEVEVEVLRKDGTDTTFKLIGTDTDIWNVLYDSGLIEHRHALTSNIKKDVYNEPMFNIKKCKVIQ